MPVERMNIGDIVQFKYSPRGYGIVKGIIDKGEVEVYYIVDWFGYRHSLQNDPVIGGYLNKVLSA